MTCTNLQILIAWSVFCFSQLIGSITISGNCRLRINKFYMHEYFCFFSLTKILYKFCVPTYWSCIHKYIGTCSKIYNQKVKYLTDNCLHADKKNSSKIVLTFIVAHIIICVQWMLIVSCLSCTQAKKPYERRMNAVLTPSSKHRFELPPFSN